MSVTTPFRTGKWRTLSADEFAASSEAKLGGMLAVIFGSALAMVVVLLLMLIGTLAFGGLLAISVFIDVMLYDSGSEPTMTIARVQAVQQALFALWALVFVVMTMTRRPSTPTVASVLMVIWAMTWIGAEIATQYLAATPGFDPNGPASAFPLILLEIVLAAAFCGYMGDGRRPNLYFRRRVRA